MLDQGGYQVNSARERTGWAWAIQKRGGASGSADYTQVERRRCESPSNLVNQTDVARIETSDLLQNRGWSGLSWSGGPIRSTVV